ncbi:Crp/Fnr family transcriptional regulator [Parahaliea mediterranea]|uniref:Crp/Fnr family transcriptional regulator n=1 Tax=Parahaliea mediterranea TaxID=651086 RepID=UPI000E2F3409|nr:Crp/Fnr family transcriptional regulator [Parahaliea mediterranea]
MNTNDVDTILGKRGWYSEQPDRLRKLILSNATIKTYGNGEFMYALGDAGRALYALVEGQAKLDFITREGNDLLLRIFLPGDWFGLVALLDEQPLPHNAFASGKATLLELSKSAFEQIVGNEPQYYRNFTKLFCFNMRDTMQREVDMGLLSPAQRLAKLLLEVDDVQKLMRTERKHQIHMSQAELCSILCASRATIIKIMKEWETDNWISYHYGKISIINQEALKHLVETAL